MCVLILLYVCPHPAICVCSGEDSGAGGSVSVEWEPALATSDICVLILLYVSSSCCMCVLRPGFGGRRLCERRMGTRASYFRLRSLWSCHDFCWYVLVCVLPRSVCVCVCVCVLVCLCLFCLCSVSVCVFVLMRIGVFVMCLGGWCVFVCVCVCVLCLLCCLYRFIHSIYANRLFVCLCVSLSPNNACMHIYTLAHTHMSVSPSLPMHA
jgi:hypothetical protein